MSVGGLEQQMTHLFSYNGFDPTHSYLASAFWNQLTSWRLKSCTTSGGVLFGEIGLSIAQANGKSCITQVRRLEKMRGEPASLQLTSVTLAPILTLGSTYPPFACGSGHIMTRDLVKTIIDRQGAKLHRFQGEDVSLGLWMTPAAPSYLQVRIS